MNDVTIQEIEEAIKQKTAEREQSIAQANFAAGQISAWTELLQRMKHSQAEAAMTSTAKPAAEPVAADKPAKTKSGNGVLTLTK